MRKTYIALSGLVILLIALAGIQARADTTEMRAVEITLTARKFKFSRPTIIVQKGQPVRLTVTSTDVEHGFAIKELKIKERIEAKQSKVIMFKPEQSGRFRYYCSVYCGDGHDDMTGELVVTDEPVTQDTQDSTAPSTMQVTFDEKEPGVVFVESNGEKVRIDTNTKAVARVEPPAGTTPAATQETTAAVEESTRPGSEPYDYYLINVPTSKPVVKGSIAVRFTHRFSQPVRPIKDSADDLLGLDSFAVSSLGLTYGITDRLYISAYRSPICQTGMCKTIEIGLGYHWLDESRRSPISLSTYASIEGNDNFTEEFTYNIQAMIGRSVTKWANIFFSPAWHINTNGQGRFDPRPGSFFPPALIAEQFRQPKSAGSLGMGVNVRVRPSVSLLFEYTPRFGFKPGRLIPVFAPNSFQIAGFTNRTEAEIGFGIEKRMGRHSFALTFSNNQASTTSKYNSSNLALPPKRFMIGFNLYRRFIK